MFTEVTQSDTEILKPADYNTGDVIVCGTLLEKKLIEKDGNELILFTFDSKGDEVGLWGTAVLKSKLSKVSEGSLVRITYQGLGKASPGKNAPHQFKVEVDNGDCKPF